MWSSCCSAGAARWQGWGSKHSLHGCMRVIVWQPASSLRAAGAVPAGGAGGAAAAPKEEEKVEEEEEEVSSRGRGRGSSNSSSSRDSSGKAGGRNQALAGPAGSAAPAAASGLAAVLLLQCQRCQRCQLFRRHGSTACLLGGRAQGLVCARVPQRAGSAYLPGWRGLRHGALAVPCGAVLCSSA